MGLYQGLQYLAYVSGISNLSMTQPSETALPTTSNSLPKDQSIEQAAAGNSSSGVTEWLHVHISDCWVQNHCAQCDWATISWYHGLSGCTWNHEQHCYYQGFFIWNIINFLIKIFQNDITRLPCPYGDCREIEDLGDYHYNGTFYCWGNVIT